MAFCEQCGAKLVGGARFCEECGAKIPDDDSGVACHDMVEMALPKVFACDDWRAQWGKVSSLFDGGECGLIITRERELVAQLHARREEFRGVLSDYVRKLALTGVNYFYLNLDECPFHDGSENVESVVATLREVASIALPKYLLILGDEKIVGVARWENQCLTTKGSDPVIESDFCYAALSLEDPWSELRVDSDSLIRVGRIPSYEGESMDEFAAYFRNSKSCLTNKHTFSHYGLSAKVWENASNGEFGALSGGRVDVSPQVTRQNISSRIGAETNLLYFNLHGSNDPGHESFWFGQEGMSYPEAVEPSSLNVLSSPYVVGVEACYGARYHDGRVPDNSILLRSMKSGCVAFLGSSRIAFGKADPPGSCADILVGEFLRQIKEGESAGDAYMKGLGKLLDSETSPTSVLTMIEFALYGDPAFSFTAGQADRYRKKSFAKRINIPMPDVERAIRMSLIEVDEKINAIVDAYVCDAVSSLLKRDLLEAAEQRVYRVRDNLNQKAYTIASDFIKLIVIADFDDSGKVGDVRISK